MRGLFVQLLPRTHISLALSHGTNCVNVRLTRIANDRVEFCGKYDNKLINVTVSQLRLPDDEAYSDFVSISLCRSCDET